MKLLLSLLVVTNLIYSLECATELSQYVSSTYLGNIRAGSSSNGRISDLKILNAFVRANPDLPAELRTTSQRGGAIIYVSARYTNRAIIGVHTGTQYTGYVEVTYNGGPPPTAPPSSDSDLEAAGGNVWGSRLNLSYLRNLNTNLGTLANTNDRTLIQAFLFQNQNLPNDLITELRVRERTNSSVRLYVPEGNLRYEGDVVVHFGSGGHYAYNPHDLMN